MSILKDFVRMIFGMEEDAEVKNYEVWIVLSVITFVCVILSMVL